MKTYLQYYNEEIRPKVEAMDILLKCETEPYEKKQVAYVLCISEEQLSYILNKQKLNWITKGVFFHLISQIKTPFCSLIHKAMQHGLLEAYTIDEISYIYNIERRYLEQEAKKLKKKSFSNEELELLFHHIYISH